MAHDVFISYSTKDKHTAEAVCSSLENSNIRCWMAPRNIVPGKEWGESIVDAISEAKIMVLIFSSNSNNSQQVLREVERAVNKNVIIIPFRIENVLPTKSMEYFLFSTHWLDALTPELETHITDLRHSIINLISERNKAAAKFAAANGTASAARLQNGAVQQNIPAGQANYKTIAIALGALLVVSLLSIGGFALWSAGNNSPVAAQTDTRTALATSTGATANPQLAAGAPGTSTAVGATAGVTASGTAATGVQSGAGITPGISGAAGTAGSTMAGDAGTSGNAGDAGNAGNAAGGANTGAGAVANAVNVKAGDYILFGNYYGQPVKWRVINVDGKGRPLLLSWEIVCIKALDAAESGHYCQTSAGKKIEPFSIPLTDLVTKFTPSELREMNGSNRWRNSSIREWLNSSSSQVSYSTTPPTQAAVNLHGYADEPGFLHNFSSADISRISATTHKSLLPDIDKDARSGGSQVYTFKSGSVQSAAANYDSAYFENTTDSVFLLSIKEVSEYMFDRGWDIRAQLSPELKKRTGLNYQYYAWWLRTPEASYSFRSAYVYFDRTNTVGHASEWTTDIGIRPALYLNSTSLPLNGSGTEAEPYVFSGN